MIEMPPVRFVETNNVRLALYAAGPAGQAPPLVLLHGFPELAFSWRHQIKDLAGQGLRVLAPDQRGYGLSDRPAGTEAYDLAALHADLIGLLDAERIEKAVFVGHDWGGLVAWPLAQRHPDRVAGIVGVNTPFLPRPAIDPIDLLRKVRGEDDYIVFFQTEGEPERLFEADLDKTFHFLMRKSDVSPRAFAARPPERRSLALHKMLPAFDPKVAGAQSILDEAELAVFVEAFRRSGFTGPINWYRNLSRNWRTSVDLEDRIDHPCLMITAENDIFLPPTLADGMERYVPNLTRIMIKGAGHWTQQEEPQAVSDAIAGWMLKTFGAGQLAEPGRKR